MMNLLQNFNQIIQTYNVIKNRPTELNKMLLNNGVISQEQYNAIKGMSPSQTGQYLLNNGILQQGQMGQLTQMVSQIQQMMGGQ